MSGVVAVGSLLAVIELGGPVASNLGLGVAVTSTGHGSAVSQALANPTAPSWGPTESSVTSATSPAPELSGPTSSASSPAATASNAANVSSVPHTVVASTPPALAAGATLTGAPSSHLVLSVGAASDPSPGNGNGAGHADVVADTQSGIATSVQPGDGGQQGQGGGHQGQGEQRGQSGQGGSDVPNVPQGKAVGQSR